MQCDNARTQLELSPNRWYSLPLVAHLVRCPECRAYRRRFALLYRTARTLPRPTVAEEMPEPLRARLSFFPALPSERRQRTLTLRIAASFLIITSAVVLGLLAGPALRPIPVSAATVQNAIQAANTWHLVGWRLQEGQKVKWEVWGRRSPFLYREQIGDEILLDDGVRRVHYIPPNRKGFRRKGICLIMLSRPLKSQGRDKTWGREPMDNHAAFLWGLGGEHIDEFHRYDADTPSRTVTLRTGTVTSATWVPEIDKIGDVEEVGTLFVNRGTRLPNRYELQRTIYREKDVWEKPEAERKALIHRQWTQAALDAEYNIPLPPSVADLDIPDDGDVVDFAATPARPTVAGFGIGQKNGVTVAARTLGRDAEGNIRLQTQVWLGGTLVQRQNMGMFARVTPAHIFKQSTIEKPYPRDDQGRAYLDINQPDADWDQNRRYATPETPKETFDIDYLVPSEPLPAYETRPRTLTIPLGVTVSIHEPMEGGNGRSRNIVEEELDVTVPLQEEIIPLDYERPRGNPQGLRWGDNIQHSLLWEAAMVRRSYWEERGELAQFQRNLPRPTEWRTCMEKSLHWSRVLLQESERLGDSKWAEMEPRNIARKEKLLKEGMPKSRDD